MTLRRIASLPVGSPIFALSKAGMRGENVAGGHALMQDQFAKTCRFFLYKRGKKVFFNSELTNRYRIVQMADCCFMSLVVWSCTCLHVCGTHQNKPLSPGSLRCT